MANDRRTDFVITIKYSGEEGQGNQKKKAPSSAKTNDGDNVSTAEQIKKGTKAILRSAAFNYAKRGINTVVGTHVNTVQLRTGQTQYQERQQAVLGYVEQGIDLAESFALGFAMGKLPGALISTAATMTFKALNLAIEQNNIRISEQVDDIGRQQAYLRAGATGGRIGKKT